VLVFLEKRRKLKGNHGQFNLFFVMSSELSSSGELFSSVSEDEVSSICRNVSEVVPYYYLLTRAHTSRRKETTSALHSNVPLAGET